MKTDCHVESEALAAQARRLGFAKVVVTKPVEPQAGAKLAEGTLIESASSRLLCSVLEKNDGLLANVFSARDFWKDDELLAALKGNYVELRFSQFLNARNKAELIAKARFFVGKDLKRGVKFRVTSGARDEFELRSPRDLVAFGIVLGLTREQAFAALGEN